jgi:inosine triphosphate pyrophosphatase
LEYDSTIGNNSQTQKKVLTFVTGNKKKLEEVQAILSTEETELAFVITNRKIDLPELQGEDPVEVAIAKCKLAAEEVQGPVFTEDTSLCFNALNGMPGLYIKWFLQKCGHVGLNSMLDGFDDRSGYAQTIVAFTMGVGEEIHVFDGRTDGEIVEARGPLDFGW